MRATLLSFAAGMILLGNASAATADSSVNLPVTQLHFYQDKWGLTVAKAWGDPAKGPHSNYIRLTAGYRSPVHTHSSSYYGVVITGVVANIPPGESDRPLPPGSYWFQKGKEPHITACLSQTECVIFVTSAGPFDLTIVH